MKKLLFLLVWGLARGAAAQAPPIAYDSAARFPIAQLRADLTYVRQALEEAHPALYWYTPKDSLDHAFARAEAALTHPMAEPEYWRLLQQLVVQVHCGHTRVQHSAAYRGWFRKQTHSYLPFLVAVRDNRLFITENQSTAALPAGTELLAIDGHPTAEILPRLRSLLAADGYGSQFKDKELEVGFFDEYYWNFYPARAIYPVLVADSAGRQQLLKPQPRPKSQSAPLQAASTPLTAAQQRARQLERLRSVSYPSHLPATAVLRIREFSYDELEDYHKFHAELFAELRKRHVRQLVLDLRGNGGGNLEIATDLLKYLFKKDFLLTRSAYARVRQPSFTQPDSTKPLYFNPASVKTLPDGSLEFANSDIGPQHPYRDRYFRGKVVVLVDGGTFSAASNTVASLRAQRPVTVIGQETGGSEAGCSGGTISKLELPATHLVLSIPHFRMLSACQQPQLGHGVRPDVEVVPTPQQVAARQDAILPQLPALLRRLPAR
jgi:hypothetical protein